MWPPPRSLWWRGIALLMLPLSVWLATDVRYQRIPETAGGVHFVTHVDRMAPEKACLIMRAADITANLKPYVCP